MSNEIYYKDALNRNYTLGFHFYTWCHAHAFCI